MMSITTADDDIEHNPLAQCAFVVNIDVNGAETALAFHQKAAQFTFPVAVGADRFVKIHPHSGVGEDRPLWDIGYRGRTISSLRQDGSERVNQSFTTC